MTALSSTRRNAITLAVLLFAQLLLMAGSVQGVGGSTLLESWTLRISSPVIGVARFVGGGFASLGSSIGNLVHAHSRNARLEAELAELRGDVQRLRSQAEENRRLRLLLGMTENLAPQGIAASIVARAKSNKIGMIIVDRGSADGVEVDCPVVAWGGAVGRVVAVSAGHAKVQLLTDPNSGAGAITQRTRTPGVVTGRGERWLEMSWLPGLSDVKEGDRVVTSGLDGIYPKGFGIGRVIRVDQSAEGTVVLQVRGELDYEMLEEVLILPRPVPEELPVGEEDEREP
jgi:rod shape-determining protein MreC